MFITMPGGLWWRGFAGGVPRVNSAALPMNNSTRQRIACVFRAPKSGTIHRVIFGTSTVASLVNLRISLQDLTSGNPDGGEDQYADHVAGDFTVNTVFRSGILSHDGTSGGNKRSVLKGDALAVVIRWTGAPGGGSQLMWTGPDGTPSPANNVHYQASYNGSSWTKSVFSPRMAVEYDDGSVAAVGWHYPQALVATPNMSSSSTPDEAGLRFIPEFSARISQAGLWTGALGAAPFTFRLYDDTDTVIGTFSVAGTQEIQNVDSPVLAHFDDVLVERDRVYRLTALPGTVSNCTLGYFTIDAVTLPIFPGSSQYYWTERTNGGAWTDNVNRMPMFLLGYSQMEVPD